MALGGRGLSLGRGAGLAGSDTGLSSGIGGLQGIDVENGIHLNFGSNIHYVKAAGSPAVFSAFTSLFTFARAAPDATYFDKSGTLRTATTNEPRINYTNGVCDGLLSEASRQNVALNNANLSAGTWTKADCTISTSTSVDSTTRSIRIVENSATAIHGVIAGMTITANTTYCISSIVRAQGRQYAYMYGINTDQFGAIFDFANLTTTQIIAGISTIAERGIIPLGNSRYLIYVSGVLNAASTTLNFVGGPAISNSVPSGYTYLGDGASGIDMEYIQVELGRFPTSRIPTTSSAVTRATDAATRTLGSEFNGSAGTFFVSGKSIGQVVGARQTFVAATDGTVSNTIPLVRPGSTDAIQLRIESGGANQTAVAGTVTNFAYFNAAGSWQSNSAQLSFNGVLATEDTSCTIPSGITSMHVGGEFGGNGCNGTIRRVEYRPEKVNDTILRGL